MILGSVLFNFKQMFRLKQMKTKDADAFKGNTLSCMIFSGLFCVILVCIVIGWTMTIPVEAEAMFDAGYTAGQPGTQNALNMKIANFHDICDLRTMVLAIPQNIDSMKQSDGSAADVRTAQMFTSNAPCKIECRPDGELDIEKYADAWTPENQKTLITTLQRKYRNVKYGDEEKKEGLGGSGKWCNFKMDANGGCKNARSMFGAGIGTEYVKLDQSKMQHCRGMVKVGYVKKTTFTTIFIGVNALFPLITMVIGTIFFLLFLKFSGNWAEKGAGLKDPVVELYEKVFADEIGQTQANPTAAGKAAGKAAEQTQTSVEMVGTEDASTDAARV